MVTRLLLHPAMRCIALFLLCTACTAELMDPSAGSSRTDEIDAYIRALPYLPVADEQVQSGQIGPEAREGDYQCTVQNLQETRQYDRIVAYAANSDALYPGALVSADSVLTGLFTQVVMPRAPAKISVSLENLEGAKSAEIAEPSLSSYREALAQILDSTITGSTPANLYSEIEAVHSEEQLDMALGVQASWGLGVASLSTAFDWSKQDVRSRHVVRYTQAYYTVDLDAPQNPSSMFGPEVTVDDLPGKIDEAHPPAYVSSVTYGRMVVFTFESEYSQEEMSAALDFAYSGGVDVRGDVSVSYKDIISRSNITAFILGGDAGSAVRTIDSYEALIAFIKEGGNYSRESPGAPIAYKLAYLKDNSPARMSFTTDYDVKDCVRVSQKVRVTLQSIAVDDAGGDAGDDLELFGRIWLDGASGPVVLFDKDDDHYATIRQGQAYGQGTPLAEAVIDVAPKAGSAIVMRANLTDYDPTSPNDSIGNDVSTNPFELGWRKDVTMQLTGDDARVRVVFSLAPI